MDGSDGISLSLFGVHGWDLDAHARARAHAPHAALPLLRHAPRFLLYLFREKDRRMRYRAKNSDLDVSHRLTARTALFGARVRIIISLLTYRAFVIA